MRKIADAADKPVSPFIAKTCDVALVREAAFMPIHLRWLAASAMATAERLDAGARAYLPECERAELDADAPP